MTEYVAGLYFDRDGRKVAMVEKLNPAWQKGKYNAIGGKIEPGEEPLDANGQRISRGNRSFRCFMERVCCPIWQ